YDHPPRSRTNGARRHGGVPEDDADYLAIARASAASEPRDRSAPTKRRARARAGESEGRSPSDRRECYHAATGGSMSCTRRAFLTAASGLVIGARVAGAGAQGANDRIRIGVIGTG